jgi:hypothetical protein
VEQIRPDTGSEGTMEGLLGGSVDAPEQADAGAAARAARRVRRRRRRTLRRVLRGVVGIVVVVLVAVGWLALRGYQARGHLQAAVVLVSQLQEQARDGNVQAARLTLAMLQEETGAARVQTGDVVWRAAGRTPWVGDDVATVTGLSRSLDQLAQQALPTLVETAASLDPASFAPVNGRIDVAKLAQVAPGIRRADDEIRRIRSDVDAVDTGGLLPPLRVAVDQLRTKLDEAAGLTGTAARAAALLPPMLGSQEPRTYLVAFQNPAEVRASGGMIGAYAVMRADRGRIQMIGQGTASADLRTFPEPVLPLTGEQRALYTDRLGIFPADVNFTPHFPTTAVLLREMYRKRTGQTVDGVLATDPVALSYLLRASGPVPLPGGGTLRADNAVPLLLSEVYSRYTNTTVQDQFFAGAARTVFDALVGGRVGGRAALTELTTAADERRLLVWSAHPGEQRLIEGTKLAGALPERDGPSPLIGVFLNDGTGAKLDYYLRQSLEVLGGTCHPGGRREIRVRVTLSSTVPDHGLPDAVNGGQYGLPRYVMRTNVLFFAPSGGAIASAKSGGEPVGISTGTERGRMAGYLTVDLEPGAKKVVEVSVLTAEGVGRGSLTPELRTTPTAFPWKIAVKIAPCRNGR